LIYLFTQGLTIFVILDLCESWFWTKWALMMSMYNQHLIILSRGVHWYKRKKHILNIWQFKNRLSKKINTCIALYIIKSVQPLNITLHKMPKYETAHVSGLNHILTVNKTRQHDTCCIMIYIYMILQFRYRIRLGDKETQVNHFPFQFFFNYKFSFSSDVKWAIIVFIA
jgi:hypothetical protein